MIFTGLLLSGLAASATANRVCRPHTSSPGAPTLILPTTSDSTLASESSTLSLESISTESELSVVTVTSVASSETITNIVPTSTDTASEPTTSQTEMTSQTTIDIVTEPIAVSTAATSDTSVPTTALGTSTTSSAPALKTRTPIGSGVGQVRASCRVAGMAALVFYGGPTQHTAQLLDLLDGTGFKGTFFLSGGSINDYTSVVQRMYASGHQVASAGWANIDMGQASPIQIQDNMVRLENAFISTIGAQPNYYMAPPPTDLVTGTNAVTTLGNLGYKVITYDIDPEDTKLGTTSDQIKNNILAGLQSGGTILPLYENSQSLVNDILPFAIQQVQAVSMTGTAVGTCEGEGSSFWYPVNP